VRRDVRRRLARLDRPAADLVLKAAVLGAEVDPPLVAVSTGVGLTVVHENLQQAVRVRLLVADPDGTLRFVVPAAADVLAADVGPVVRADLHRQAAEHLLRSAPETEARTIARHLLAAAGHVPPQQLTAGVLRVVQAACASGQLADADRWCRSALEALRPGTAGPSRVELLLRHGAVLRELSGEADARAAYLDAAALAATQEDPTLEARAALDLADLVAEWGIPDPQLVGHLESALARLPTVDSALLAQVEARLASQLGADREVPTPRGLDLVNNAIDRAYRVGEARALAVALGAWHETLHGPDHLAARLDTIDEMADQAAIADHRDTMLAAARHRRHSLLQRGDVVAADVELASYGRLSGAHPTGGNAWRLDLMRAGRALLEGRFADAARLSESAEARAGDGPARPRAVQYRFIQDFLLQRELGQLGDLDPRGPNVPGAQDISFTARAIHAYLMGELGQRAAAGIELDRFLIQGPDEIPNGSLLMPTLTLLAQAAVRHGHRAAAEVLYRALLPWSGQAIVVASGSTIWGAVNRLLGELAGVLGSPDDAVAHLDDALVLETRLAAGPLVTRTKVSLAAALSRRGSDGDADRSRELLAEAVDTARALGMAGVLADAEAVAAEARPVEVDLRTPAVGRPARRTPDATRKPRQRVHCLGGYRIELGGGPVDLSVVKPRVRAALWLLSIHGGRPVHRERLMDALWPDADPVAGKRNLQVAVSSLRQALEPGVKRGSAALLVRDGDSYRLALDDDAEVDVNKFAAAMAEGEAARRHAPDVALAAYDEALSWYGGDLIPEAGPAEWIVTWRDARRMEAVDAAVAVAELRAERGEVRAVIAACDRGLYLDRYCDPLWRLQIDAYESAGDHAAAAQARQGYRAVCDELGIDGPTR
jgi:DNA-binding SARP family transcriptional activator